jgi:hypothetical protein
MKRMRILRAGAVVLACAGMLLPTPVVQAAGVASNADSRGRAPETLPEIVDLALGDGGTFRGQIVDAQGQPLARTAVSVRNLDREVASAVSDESGPFGGFKCCPPKHRPVLCRSPLSQMKFWLAHPLVIAGIVATAVAIPVAIHNSKSHSK